MTPNTESVLYPCVRECFEWACQRPKSECEFGYEDDDEPAQNDGSGATP
jgi:hypothetical protein